MPAQPPVLKPAPAPSAPPAVDWEAIEEASDEEPSFDEIAAAQSVRPVAPRSPTAITANANGAAAALAASSAGQPSPCQPSHYWTWRLLAAGFAADDCVAIRGIVRDVVLDHALRAIDSGWAVEAQWLLDARLIAALAELVGDKQPERIRPLLAKLPNGTRYEEVQLYIKCRFPGGSHSV